MAGIQDIFQPLAQGLQRAIQREGAKRIPGGPLQDLVQSGPTLTVRDWDPFWTRPEKWKNKTLKTAWKGAKKMAPTTVMTPKTSAEAVSSVMASIAETNALLRGIGQSTERTSIQRDLHELASGLFGTAATEDGQAVGSYNPASLGGLGFGALVVYTVSAHGLKFDATAAAFAEKTASFGRNLVARARRLSVNQAVETRPWRAPLGKIKKAVGPGLILGLGALGIGTMVLLSKRK